MTSYSLLNKDLITDHKIVYTKRIDTIIQLERKMEQIANNQQYLRKANRPQQKTLMSCLYRIILYVQYLTKHSDAFLVIRAK